jgi:hypothetical protein
MTNDDGFNEKELKSGVRVVEDPAGIGYQTEYICTVRYWITEVKSDKTWRRSHWFYPTFSLIRIANTQKQDQFTYVLFALYPEQASRVPGTLGKCLVSWKVEPTEAELKKYIEANLVVMPDDFRYPIVQVGARCPVIRSESVLA